MRTIAFRKRFRQCSLSELPSLRVPALPTGSVRALFNVPDDRVRSALDPRHYIRWIYVGRLTLASGIFVAALLRWFSADTADLLIATLGFALSVVFTAWSLWVTKLRARPLTTTFLYVQLIFDTLLVTAVVHVTGRQELSWFAPLYIVVNTSAALLLPIGSSLLLAVFGSVLYTADVLLLSEYRLTFELATQVSVFIAAALGTGWISARLQQIGASSQQLVAELTQARLEAADILANIRSGILTVDTSGVLLYANPAAADLLGVPLHEFEGQPVMSALGAVSPGLHVALERAVAKRTSAARQEAVVLRDGREIPVGITTTSNERAGGAGRRSVTAIFLDISDQKRLDELRGRTERLEAIAELGASLAHEIRNPLASIRSAIEQLATAPRATPDEQTLSRLIVRESDRLSRLLGEFLDFARVRVTTLEQVDLAVIARNAANLAAEHPSRSEGVRVDVITPPDPVVVEGDEDLLHRAVFNLVLNALQSVPPGGAVRVEVGTDPGDDVPSGEGFDRGVGVVRVVDNGPGIDPAIRERIFQPFATTKPGGTGLGLALAHRAVEAHRGLLLVDTGDVGTRFSILIPRVQARTSRDNGENA